MNLEDRLRRALADAGERHSPPPAAWANVQARLGGRREPRPAAKVLTIGFALALGVGGVALAVRAFSGSVSPATEAGSGSLNPRVVGSVDVSALVTGILPTRGQAWLVEPEQTLTGECDGALGQVKVGVNGRLLELTTVVPTGGVPQASTVAGSDLWIVQYACSAEGLRPEILRMDAVTGQRGDLLQLTQEGSPSAISEYESTLTTVWNTPDQGNLILETESDTGAAIVSREFEGRLSNVESTQDALWVLDSGPERGSLLRLDPVTLDTVARWELGESPSGLVVGADGAIWVGTAAGLARVDPSGDMTEVNTDVVGPTPIGADGVGVWFVGADPEGSGSLLSHVDSVTLEMDAKLALNFAGDDGAIDSEHRRIWLTTTIDETHTRLVLIDY